MYKEESQQSIKQVAAVISSSALTTNYPMKKLVALRLHPNLCLFVLSKLGTTHGPIIPKSISSQK